MDKFSFSATSKPVMVALDLSERSAPCLTQGCEMAVKFRQPLLVVHVVHETGETEGMYRRHHSARDTVPLHDIARSMLDEQLAAFRDACHGLSGVSEIQSMVVDGVPETRIPELARIYNASMIVMSSHNRRGLSHWLYGSVSESVLRRAPCPVVLVGRQEGSFTPLTVHRPKVPDVTAAQGA